MTALFLLALSAVLFASQNSIAAWIMFVPLFLLVRRLPLRWLGLFGAVYGFVAYILLLPWLFRFSPPAMLGVGVLYSALWLVQFFVLKLVQERAKGGAFLLQPLCVVLFEFIKTRGFFGFSYGVSGYTQYKNLPLIQIASFCGVFGVSFLLAYCSSVVYEVCFVQKSVKNKKSVMLICSLMFFVLGSSAYGALRIHRLKARDSLAKKITVIAVQHDTDPWKGGIDAYEADVERLITLTEDALLKNPEASLVVWPETAVVPSILKHYDGTDERRRNLVRRLLSYIDEKDAVFVIGNQHVQGGSSYNSAFVFIPGNNVVPPAPEHYEKMHLIPLTEYFPYEAELPAIYHALESADTHFWTPGTKAAVFSAGDFRFSTPICFEDSFGADCRRFFNDGARAFLNLSNDAWAKSRRCQVQHLQCAVFRSVENAVPSVRSTASGETCAITSWGRIESRCLPFCPAVSVSRIPVLP